ncbi:Ig-like domain-containing protein [Rhodococcus marinonascens]|uniref:Ig-like domain-containing protein n=1 Tax=Rhodococcus marinonascens TaxID=38311 RepID=UPI000932AF5E|nr:Ig-like domain-containing protein [Rhodococcus marinonascens]
MSDRNIRRAVGVVSAVVVAAGFAVTTGASVAGATPAAAWTDGFKSFTRMVSDVNPSSIVLSVPNDLQVGQSASVTATVINQDAHRNTGFVEFYDGTTKIGEDAVQDHILWGTSAFDWTPTTAGEHIMSAKYVGNPQAEDSRSDLQIVQVASAPEAETAMELTGPPAAQTGTEVSFEAQVSPTPEGGTVQFRDGDRDLGAPVPMDADGKASITHTFNSEGTHDIIAVYSGAPGYSGSTAEAVTVTVTVTDADGGTDGNTDGGDGGNTDEPDGTGSAGNIFGS